ncbi:MAG: hypothetical protein IJ840_09505 [Bacteroidales bacterium]|nr:hypothetical protein [Bacteroidales bacterium]
MRKTVFITALCAIVFSACGKNPVVKVDEKGESLISSYVAEFNAADEEIYIQKFPNSRAEEFLQANIPVFECPDKELEKTWYFRWWTFRKHVKSTPEGFVITEFLPEVSWAGKYNAICCPAAHHFNEGRWLKDPTYLKDYAAYWCRERQDARRYSFPAAHAFLQFYKVHPDKDLIEKSYPDLKLIYSAWENDHRDDPAGLFWQGDGHDGMEVSISGALSPDATGYRATINSYMYADAVALSTMATMLGKPEEAEVYSKKAEQIKDLINTRLWDESARFYKVIPRHGDGSFSPAREEHGYTPWLYDIPKPEWADAWMQLTDPEGFKAPFGPTTAERRAEGFKVFYGGHECQWNGPGWPFATAQTLTALERHLHRRGEGPVTKKDWFETLLTYSDSHRRTKEDGTVVCWIDENQDPFTGEWLARKLLLQGNNKYKERGKDYNHSSFCDLVISGLAGIQPQLDGSIVIEPLLPEGEWDWFSLSKVHVAGKEISVVFDKNGDHYGKGKGFAVYVDGKKVGQADSYSTKIVI